MFPTLRDLEIPCFPSPEGCGTPTLVTLQCMNVVQDSITDEQNHSNGEPYHFDG